MYYTILSVSFGLLNLFLFIGFRWYKFVVTTNCNASDKEYQKATSAYLFASGLWFVSLSSFLLFGGISFGKLLNTFLSSVSEKEAISMEETFLINFVISAGLLGLVFLNGMIKEIINQTKIFRQDANNTSS